MDEKLLAASVGAMLMGTVTQIGFSLQWGKPVYVGESDKLDQTVTGPADAVRWMQGHFKHKRGVVYWRARALCYEALLGTLHHDFARQPFVDAWVEQALFEQLRDT
jgi:hypothetical protein